MIVYHILVIKKPEEIFHTYKLYSITIRRDIRAIYGYK